MKSKKELIWRFSFSISLIILGLLLEINNISREFLGFNSIGNWLIYVGFIILAITTINLIFKKERKVDERMQFIGMKSGRITFLVIILISFFIMIFDGIKEITTPYYLFMSYWISGIVLVYFISYKILEKKY